MFLSAWTCKHKATHNKDIQIVLFDIYESNHHDMLFFLEAAIGTAPGQIK